MGYNARERDPGGARERSSRIRLVLWAVLGLNLVVAVAKLVYGFASGSVAMQADGFHSLFDGTSNVVGLVGMALAARPADPTHPYGHGKYETYASAAIGALLAFAAWRVGSEAFARLTGPVDPPRVDAVSFAVMAGTLLVNIVVTTMERRAGKRLRSDILIADASHTASDMLVSVSVILGLIAVRMGYERADAIIALLVAGAIVFTAWSVFRQANVTLSDSTRIPPGDVCLVVLEVPGVLGCHSVRTRGSEAEVYVDLHVQVSPDMTVRDGHQVAEAVERRVNEAFPQAVDVIAHLEPLDEYQAEKTARERDSGRA